MKKYYPIIFCFIIFSCELSPPPPECIIQAPFDHLVQGSDAYQGAAIEKIENAETSNYRYFFKTFLVRDDEDLMTVNFRNQQECFDVDILVEKWDKLGGMKKVNGKSYPKELINLTWNIEERKGSKKVVYQDMNWIRD